MESRKISGRSSAPGERRIERLLFAAAFVAYAWFHQGGGWNQNARFAMVRAVVEEGTFSIDSYLVHAGARGQDGMRLFRLPVREAEFTVDGKRYAFWWRDQGGNHVRLNEGSGESAGRTSAPGGVTYVDPEEVAVTGDVAFHAGRFHPAKAPGGALVAVPAYFILYRLERMLGVDPDGWRALAFNAWATSALSVGLLAALGCVLLYRLALGVSGRRKLESLLAALSFAFGTMLFPYATALYEHDVIAVALLASFYLLHRVKELASSEGDPLPERRARAYLALAGASAGYAAVANYAMAIPVLLLLGYAVLAVRRRGGWRWYALGVLVPFLLLCAYNIACFGTPFTTNYRYEAPVFKTGGAFLEVFLWPQWDVLLAVLVSPYRGLFVTAPVLLLGVFGLVEWLRSGRNRAEAWLAITMLAFFLLLVTTFNGWHGGWAVGPRYLAPALPFLALPAVAGFARFFKLGCALAALSAAANLLVTAVDPQAPVGSSPKASVEGRPQWLHSPLTEWELPLFLEGRAWPLFRAQRDRVLGFYEGTMQAGGVPTQERMRRLAELRERIDADVREGKPAPLLVTTGPDGQPGLMLSELPTFVGPVSVNPMGIYEGWAHRVFPAGSAQASWNSFNAGELLFPGSRWSLAPLLLVVGILVTAALRTAARPDSRPGR